MYLTSENLELLFGFYFKAKKNHKKLNPNWGSKQLWAMMMIPNPSNIIMRKLAKSLSFKIFVFCLSQVMRPLQSQLQLHPMCLVRGSPREACSWHWANSDSLKWKWSEEEEPQERKCTRGICVDCWYLQNPFPDEEDDLNKVTFTSNEQIYAIIVRDEFTSLKNTRNSPDWLEWEKAIQSKLNQLHQMGTWWLVEKPLDAIPIANKWMFIKKCNKAGEIIKFKARLVVKGCTQRPGYNYAKLSHCKRKSCEYF